MSEKQKLDEAGGELILKVWENEEFKKELISNPKPVLKKELGADFPEDVTVNVLVEDAKNLYFVIPMKPKDTELSDELLEKVAGGAGYKFPPGSLADPATRNRAMAMGVWNSSLLKRCFSGGAPWWTQFFVFDL